MFSVHIAPEEYKNATNAGQFGFVFEEKSRDYRDVIVFRKAPFPQCIPSSIPVWRAFSKSSDRLVLAVAVTVGIKPAAFVNFSGVVRGHDLNHFFLEIKTRIGYWQCPFKVSLHWSYLPSSCHSDHRVPHGSWNAVKWVCTVRLAIVWSFSIVKYAREQHHSERETKYDEAKLGRRTSYCK